MVLDPKELSTVAVQQWMQGAVSPRPIAFASTVDKDGKVNLSPFSFFNMFSANPPMLIFSPARRVRDNTTKHTLENVLEVPEVVINIVNYAMVEQMSLSSCEYDRGINEFTKAGFTEAPSLTVRPPRVAEAPVSFECEVKDVIALGIEGGAGNLILCEVKKMHVQESILNSEGRIDPYKLDAVARLGGDFYCRVQGDAIFELPKPVANKGIGVDQIPLPIRSSKILTGNNLGRLGNIEQLPSAEETKDYLNNNVEWRQLTEKKPSEADIHRFAQQLLEKKQVKEAWIALLSTL